MGLAVIVDARGNPDFIQFAARPDGKDYGEFTSQFLARWQVQGTKTPREYTETPVDERTVVWADKFDGKCGRERTKVGLAGWPHAVVHGRQQKRPGPARHVPYVFDRQDGGR